jgi:hypothetical protein
MTGGRRAGSPLTAAEAEPGQRQQRRDLGRDDALDTFAPTPTDELVVLLAQLPTGPEQGALNDPLGHPEGLPDLRVRAALELAHDDEPVVTLGQAAERASEVVEALFVLAAASAP